MANIKIAEFGTSLFEDLSDEQLQTVVGGQGFIENGEQGANNLLNGLTKDPVGSPASTQGLEQGSENLVNGTLSTQYNIVLFTTQQLGTQG